MRKDGMALTGAEEQEENWRERHGVNCYFCGTEFDERDGVPADPMNGGDGGTACARCAREREGNERE